MSLNDTVSAERIHISFFGQRNAGKSSLVNRMTNQKLSVVSDTPGTTTDPVKKAMELLPLGPVLIIDTPGYDDSGELGEKRVEKTREILAKTDIAILVIDALDNDKKVNDELISLFQERKIPYITVYNKSDLLKEESKLSDNEIYVSAKDNHNIDNLKNMLSKFADDFKKKKYIVVDLLEKDDIVILVTPIDESAPKGRLILPQQQVIRELLDNHMTVYICQSEELEKTIKNSLRKPKLIITDSQAFSKVSKITPDDILLTSFSILFARYKGSIDNLKTGIKVLDNIEDGDKILISEGCTHHRQCNDIGSVKIPNWIHEKTGKNLQFAFTQGGEFPKDLSEYKLVIHCGACMLNEKEMKYRMEVSAKNNVPMINYGICIAYIHGILDRALAVFNNK